MILSLCDLAAAYGTDKEPSRHGYTCIYCSYWPEYGPSYIPHLHVQIDQVIYPCPATKADHADRRNSPRWAEIEPELNDFERQTESIQLCAGLIIYQKRKEYL